MSVLFLSTILPWTITICLAIVCLIALRNIPAMTKSFMAFPASIRFALCVAFVGGGMLRFLAVPNDHRIYFDEDRYLSYAVTFARFGKAVSVELATPTQSLMGNPDQAGRVTVPVINAWALKLLGFKETHLYVVAKAINTLTILLMFITTYALFGNAAAAVVSAIGIAFLPTPVYFSTATGFDPYLVFFCLLSLLAVCRYAHHRNWDNAIFLIASVLLLMSVRIEAITFLFVLITTFFILHKQSDKTISVLDKATAMALATLLGLRLTISLSVFGKPWCCAEALPLEAFHPTYLIRDMFPNIMAYATKTEFPFIITLLAVVAIVQRNYPTVLVPILWSALFFVIYSSYYAGMFFDFQFSGSYGRFFLTQIPPLLMLAGLTVSDIITRTIHAPKNLRNRYVVLGVVAMLTFIPTIRKYPAMITYSPYDRLVEAGPRILHTFLDSTFIGATSPNDIIIHNLTAPILLSGRTAVYSGYWYDHKEVQDFIYTALKDGKHVYYDQTRRCELFPDSCTKLLTKFILTPVKTQAIQGLSMEMDEVTLKPEP